MTAGIVDSHVHVWARGRAFGGPGLGAGGTAAADAASIEDLITHMRVEGVAAAILVQHIGYGVDNSYVAGALKAHPDLFAGVCRVDPGDPEAPDQLSFWTEQHGFHGVRIGPPAAGGVDWLTGPLVEALFARAGLLGVPVVLLTGPAYLAELRHMVDRHPDVDIVIDHMADSDIFNPFHRDNLIGIAQNPRVHLKTGHVWATSSEGYPWRDRQELVRFACETFGPRRIMWGSDWPLCARHTTYRQTFGFLTEDTDFLSGDDLEWILGGTARCLWPIGGVRPDRLSQASNYRSGQVPK